MSSRSQDALPGGLWSSRLSADGPFAGGAGYVLSGCPGGAIYSYSEGGRGVLEGGKGGVRGWEGGLKRVRRSTSRTHRITCDFRMEDLMFSLFA